MTDDSPSPGRVRRRAGRLALVAGAVAVTGVVAVGAVAWAGASTDPGAPAVADDHDHAGADTPAAAGRDGTAPGAGGAGRGGRHRHPTQPPYAERYAAAPAGEQQAADELVADVRATLAAYADPAAAVAAGYRAPGPRRSPGPVQHYLNRDLARDGDVLDPARPDGLVYYTGGDQPVLLGAFFVAQAGAEAPTPAPDLVVWHTHDPACPAFFVTDEAPCAGSRRMLHVWTAEQLTWISRRTGEPVDVTVADPFGAPFRASIAAAG